MAYAKGSIKRSCPVWSGVRLAAVNPTSHPGVVNAEPRALTAAVGPIDDLLKAALKRAPAAGSRTYAAVRSQCCREESMPSIMLDMMSGMVKS